MKRRPLIIAVVAAIVVVAGGLVTLKSCTNDDSPAPDQTVTFPEPPTPAPTGAPVSPTAESVLPRVVETGTVGALTSVAVDSGANADQVVFTFENGGVPAYEIGYVDLLLVHEEPFLLDGGAVMTVTFTGSSPGPDSVTAEDVPTNENYDGTAVRQIVLAQYLGETVTFGVGVSTQLPYRVEVDDSTLTLIFPTS